MATIKDVAKKAGVGISSVSRYLNKSGYVSEENKAKIEKAISELNYKPSYIARTLKARHAYMVALFVPTISHPFFCKIAYYIEQFLYERGYKTVIISSQNNKQKEIDLLAMLEQNQVDGAIFITHHYYEKINPKLPIVTIDRHLAESVPCITSDNYQSSRKALEFLAERGCKNIGFIGGQPRTESEVLYRYYAYQEFVHERKMPSIVSYSDIAHGEEYEVVRAFFEKNPQTDGVFTVTDMLANMAYQYAVANGKKVPQDLKIISYDGIMSEWVQYPKFTCVKQDLESMAKTAVETLLRKIKGKHCDKKIVIPCSFIEGETT